MYTELISFILARGDAAICCCGDELLQSIHSLGTGKLANYLAGREIRAASAVICCRVMQSKAGSTCGDATLSYGDCQMALLVGQNQPCDKTPRGPPRVVHLSSDAAHNARRPRISRVADASSKKKEHPRAGDDDDDETEYYKVS